MKLLTHLSLTVALTASALAAGPSVAGPKGGRLLDTTPLRAEFFITPERRVEVTFYDAALQPTAPAAQVVSITAEPRTGRTAVALAKTDSGYASSAPLPESAEPYRVVVQVREAPGAKPQNFRVDLNLAECAECQRAEYACTCESH